MTTGTNQKSLSTEQTQELLVLLQSRFEQNMSLHKDLKWPMILTKLQADHDKLWSLSEMERTGGEPNVVVLEKGSNQITFVDCSIEEPKGRRSLCYDGEAHAARKENKPVHNAIDMAIEMGIELLTEREYRQFNSLGHFDLKTSSWIATPDSIRKLGGALFAHYRYGQIFVYHNGAESYYATREFRGILRV